MARVYLYSVVLMVAVEYSYSFAWNHDAAFSVSPVCKNENVAIQFDYILAGGESVADKTWTKDNTVSVASQTSPTGIGDYSNRVTTSGTAEITVDTLTTNDAGVYRAIVVLSGSLDEYTSTATVTVYDPDSCGPTISENSCVLTCSVPSIAACGSASCDLENKGSNTLTVTKDGTYTGILTGDIISVCSISSPPNASKAVKCEAGKDNVGLIVGIVVGVLVLIVLLVLGLIVMHKKKRGCFGKRGGAGGGGAGGGGAGGAGGDGQANGGNGGTTTQPSPDQKAKNRRLPPSSPDSGSQESPRHVSHRPQPPPPSSANPEHPSKPGHVAVVRPQPLPPAGQPQGNLYTRGLSANLEDPKSLVYQTNRLDPLDLKQKREELKDEDEQTEQKKKKKKKKKTLKTETEDKMADEAEDDL